MQFTRAEQGDALDHEGKRWFERIPRGREAAYGVAGFVMALAIGVGAQSSGGSATPQDCDVRRAGEFAVQANLQLINAAQVNPGKYFVPGGQDSCISNVMLQSFDLSNLIPDFGSLITGAIEGAITSAIGGAMNRVCNAANNAIQGTVGNINNAISGINGQLNAGGQFGSLLAGELGLGSVPNVGGGGATYGTGNNTGGNAFGITGPVGGTGSGTGTGTGGSAGTGGTGGTTAIGNIFGSGSASASTAIALAAESERRRIAMEQAWSNYLTSINSDFGSPDSSYQAYLASVDSYNAGIAAERAAQQGTGFGSGQNTYSGLSEVVARPPQHGTPQQSPQAGGSAAPSNNSSQPSIWSRMFGGTRP